MSNILNIVQQQHITVAKINAKEGGLTQAPLFKDELLAAIDTYKQHVLVDFSQVEYVDSSFLGALVSGLKHAVSYKLDVAVTGLAKDIHNLFGLIRLDKVFKIYASQNEALAAMNK